MRVTPVISINVCHEITHSQEGLFFLIKGRLQKYHIHINVLEEGIISGTCVAIIDLLTISSVHK